MRPSALLALAALAACSPVSGRFEVMSRAPSFRVKSVAIAAVRGARGQSAAIARRLAAKLGEAGIRAEALDESDSVLAGSALGLETAVNPRLLAEIRSATGADAVIFVSLDPTWRSLDASAVDARSGDAVLRASGRPRGEAFKDAEEAAEVAARALEALSSRPRRPDPTRVDDGLEEIPVP